MSMSTPPVPVSNEHTFGHQHFSPPPLEQEQSSASEQASGAEDEWDLLHRIRSVGEW
ncbi:MAG: hypothetical protein LBJ15_23670 [Comamonas sp.]|jgi:hypothetical protein|uniref:hypothetical protein n=1 Tax=Comamonas sp. TaxID=34028 RepID=UPI00282B5D58|nr:hypothetical protein [Comamonas sp.]MDR0216986.1 hypothetical protein [Comamonas sp.]MDR2299421.1 hypothetical protein [Comamonas sp.]